VILPPPARHSSAGLSLHRDRRPAFLPGGDVRTSARSSRGGGRTQRALRIDPKHVPSRFRGARVVSLQGRFGEAQASSKTWRAPIGQLNGCEAQGKVAMAQGHRRREPHFERARTKQATSALAIQLAGGADAGGQTGREPRDPVGLAGSASQGRAARNALVDVGAELGDLESAREHSALIVRASAAERGRVQQPGVVAAAARACQESPAQRRKSVFAGPANPGYWIPTGCLLLALGDTEKAVSMLDGPTSDRVGQPTIGSTTRRRWAKAGREDDAYKVLSDLTSPSAKAFPKGRGGGAAKAVEVTRFPSAGVTGCGSQSIRTGASHAGCAARGMCGMRDARGTEVRLQPNHCPNEFGPTKTQKKRGLAAPFAFPPICGFRLSSSAPGEHHPGRAGLRQQCQRCRYRHTPEASELASTSCRWSGCTGDLRQGNHQSSSFRRRPQTRTPCRCPEPGGSRMCSMCHPSTLRCPAKRL